MASSWLEHVKATLKTIPKGTADRFKVALKKAKMTYKKGVSPAKKTAKKSRKSRRKH